MDMPIASINATIKTADRLLRFAEAREIVGISRSKIYLLLQDQAFPKPVKVGRDNFFSERELQNWIRAQLENRTNVRAEA